MDAGGRVTQGAVTEGGGEGGSHIRHMGDVRELSADDIAIRVSNLGKCYHLYDAPRDRLKQFVVPRLRRLAGQVPKQYFREFWALKDVSFEIKKGETVGIIGINGAGKSTLLKLITGTTQPTVGSVCMEGRVAALLELGMGFHPDFTGRQNAFMAGQLLGMCVEEITSLMPEIETFAEIGDYIDQPVRIYSSGMQVRLAFSVATVKRPEILIVDEALSVGDAYFQHKCFSRIRQLQDQGTTLLFVSHDIAAVRALCARSIWLDNGVIREVGETKFVLDAYATALYARQQDIDSAAKTPAVKDGAIKGAAKPQRDCRLDFINNSNLRNDIEVFGFNKDAARWGDGLAKITTTYLQDTNGTPLSWIIGGEEVVLTIEARALQDLRGVILGFMVRDRLGQNLFGDNTFITTFDSPVSIKSETLFRAKFCFLMPILPQGTYAITAAIATGTQQDHVIHDWVNESLFFESHNGFSVSGLVGVPMHGIQIEELNSTCS